MGPVVLEGDYEATFKKVLRFLSSLMPGGREFHTVLLRVAVYVVRCAALRASACMGI